MYGIPIVLGIFMGVSTATRWGTVLQYLNRTPFGQVDPQFGLDVSFYVYELPFYRGVLAYASAVFLVAALAAIATNYLYGGIRVNGREVRITRPARVQLAITGAIYLALQAVSIWFDQYATLLNDGDLITGAAYTDVNAVIPGRLILSGIAAVVAVLFIVTAVDRTLAPAPDRHRAAHRLEHRDRRDLPGAHRALPGDPDRADPRGPVHQEEHRGDARRRTASTTSSCARTTRRPTRARARCARTPRRRPTSESSTRRW